MVKSPFLSFILLLDEEYTLCVDVMTCIHLHINIPVFITSLYFLAIGQFLSTSNNYKLNNIEMVTISIRPIHNKQKLCLLAAIFGEQL